jgi:RNA polymerase sigma factor (sigma-70 family)
MPKSQPDSILSYLRNLLESKELASVPDGRLLERFVSEQAEPAFNALLKRHGPMVLAVSRRLVGNDHDAEEVFQATFIILARKARAIRKRQAIGSWLHGVAQRLAIRARGQASRRKLHEQNVASMKRVNLEPAWSALNEQLDSAIQDLPAKYREAIVLCYLEGNTQEQSAKLLGCPLGTVRSRVAQARKLLRDRLVRRGLNVSVGAFTTVLATGAAANAVPTQLRHTTLKAAVVLATGKTLVPGFASSQVITLVNGGLKAMAAAKIKLASMVIVSASLLAVGAGAVGNQIWTIYDPTGLADTAFPEEQAKSEQKKLPTKPDQAKAADQENITVRGRVVDGQGDGVAGANVGLFSLISRGADRSGGPNTRLQEESLAEGISDTVGRFQLRALRKAFDDSEGLFVVAAKKGLGPALERIATDKPGNEIVLQLPSEKVLRGRLFDLQGQPAADVQVKLYWFGWGPLRAEGSVSVAPEKQKSPFWPEAVVTDKEGRYEIRGLSTRLQGYMSIEGDLFAREVVEIKAGDQKESDVITKALRPAQIIEGVITGADTGKPLPHVQLVVGNERGGGLVGESDDMGRFRVKTREPGTELRITAIPGAVPYPPYVKNIKWPPGATKQTVDLALPRGVLLRGKVTEQGTGKPVAGARIHDYAPDVFRFPWMIETGPDGIFHIAVPIGTGRLMIKHPDNDFIPLELTQGELNGKKPGGRRWYPDAIISFDAKIGDEAQEVHAEVRRGVTIKGLVVRPDGSPVAEGIMMCWNQLPDGDPKRPQRGVREHDGQFELRGCDPEITYPVYFLDPVDRLGSTVYLSAKDAGEKPVKVQLAPCVDAVGRFVDIEGKPLVKQRVNLYFVFRSGGKAAKSDEDFIQHIDRHNYPELQDTDAEGRCTFPALIPGAVYKILNYNTTMSREFTVRAGETVQLGDVVFDRPN